MTSKYGAILLALSAACGGIDSTDPTRKIDPHLPTENPASYPDPPVVVAPDVTVCPYEFVDSCGDASPGGGDTAYDAASDSTPSDAPATDARTASDAGNVGNEKCSTDGRRCRGDQPQECRLAKWEGLEP